MDRRLVNLLITPDGDFVDEKAKLTYMLITLSDIADSKIDEANKVAEEASKLLERYYLQKLKITKNVLKMYILNFMNRKNKRKNNLPPNLITYIRP